MATLKLNSYELFTQSENNNPNLGSGFPKNEFIPAKGIVYSDGSTTAVGNNVDMLSLSIDLTNYEGYLLYGWCHTAIAENSNNSNTARIRLKLHNGTSTTYFASQRQGISVYSSVGWSTNDIASLGCQGYFVVTNTFATSCTLYMNGGVNDLNGQFSWGDQGNYTFFDGETPNAGGTLGFILFRM